MTKCPICLCVVSSREPSYKCGHKMHHRCLIRWNGTCPICMANIIKPYNTRNKTKLYTINIKKRGRNVSVDMIDMTTGITVTRVTRAPRNTDETLHVTMQIESK